MNFTLYVIFEIGLFVLVVVAIGYAFIEATREEPEEGGDESS